MREVERVVEYGKAKMMYALLSRVEIGIIVVLSIIFLYGVLGIVSENYNAIGITLIALFIVTSVTFPVTYVSGKVRRKLYVMRDDLKIEDVID